MFSQVFLFTFFFTAAHFHLTGSLTFLIFSLALYSPGGQDDRNMDVYHQVNQYRLNTPLKLKQEHAYSGIQVLPAWRLDRKMRRRLILQET